MEKQLTYEQVFLKALKGDIKSKKVLIGIWRVLANNYYLSIYEDNEEYKNNNKEFDTFVSELINLMEEKEEPILVEDINKFIEIEMKEIPLQRKRT